MCYFLSQFLKSPSELDSTLKSSQCSCFHFFSLFARECFSYFNNFNGNSKHLQWIFAKMQKEKRKKNVKVSPIEPYFVIAGTTTFLSFSGENLRFIFHLLFSVFLFSTFFFLCSTVMSEAILSWHFWWEKIYLWNSYFFTLIFRVDCISCQMSVRSQWQSCRIRQMKSKWSIFVLFDRNYFQFFHRTFRFSCYFLSYVYFSFSFSGCKCRKKKVNRKSCKLSGDRNLSCHHKLRNKSHFMAERNARKAQSVLLFENPRHTQTQI